MSKGLTQEQLAAALEISRDTVAYYESKVKSPSLGLLNKLAQFFQVSPAIFIDDGQHKKQPGPKSKLEKQLELIKKLPPKKQDAISTVLDMALQQAQD